MTTGRDIAVVETQASPPRDQVAMQSEWATVLMEVVEKKKLYATIEGKKYLEAEAWGLILAFAGVGPETEWVRPIEEQGEIVGYEAKVNLVKNGQIVGGAIMSCGLDEFPCRGKEGQAKAKAAKSAAQTWAMSKAARQKYSLVPILAGYAPTPAEEMVGASSQPDAASEFYCAEHKTLWFKSKKMRNYAHPIKETGEWCNMPSPEAPEGGSKAPASGDGHPGAEKAPVKPGGVPQTESTAKERLANAAELKRLTAARLAANMTGGELAAEAQRRGMALGGAADLTAAHVEELLGWLASLKAATEANDGKEG